MEICIVINFFQEPFRKADMQGNPQDAERINKHGKRLLFVMNANLCGTSTFMKTTLPNLTLNEFNGIWFQDNTSKEQVALPRGQFKLHENIVLPYDPITLATLMGNNQGVKIIITGHGEPGVPFIFDDGGEQVDVWMLLKGLLEFMTRGLGSGGLGLGSGQRSWLRISLPICYAASGTYSSDNDSVCYELARYFMFDSVAQEVRKITKAEVRISGAKNVIYGIANRGYPERSDFLQNKIEQALSEKAEAEQSKGSQAQFDLKELRRGGKYTSGKSHSSHSFRPSQAAIKVRNQVRDEITQNTDEDDKMFSLGEGNKVLIEITYPGFNQCSIYIRNKYTALDEEYEDMPLKDGSAASFQRYRPGYRRGN